MALLVKDPALGHLPGTGKNSRRGY
jgi:hypothetical protein